MYKQSPKSPMLKALKGNQGKLPQHLQDVNLEIGKSKVLPISSGYHRQSTKKCASMVFKFFTLITIFCTIWI